MTDYSRIYDFFHQTKRAARDLDANTVRRASLDDGMFEQMRDSAEVFRDRVEQVPDLEGMSEDVSEEARERYVHWDDLMGDIFKALHTGEDPGVLDSGEIKPSREVNRRIAQRIIASDEFNAVKPDCRHAEIESAFTAMSMGGELEKLLSNELSEMGEQANQAAKKERQAEVQQQKLDDLRQQVRDQGGDASDEQKDAMKEAAKRKTNARREIAKLQAQMQQAPITVAAADRMQKAADEGKKAAQVMASLPGIGRGHEKDMSADEQLRLAQLFKDNPELFRIAEMVGRIIRDMRFKRARRIVGGTEEVVDVEMGNHIPDLLTSEVMKLAMGEEIELDFYRRFYEKGLLQYAKRGVVEAGRGPLVCVIDGSYSMKGQRNIWARALALALLHISRREKRDFYAVEFSHADLMVWEFKHNTPLEPDQIANMAGHQFGGGTDITIGLERADEEINRAPEFSKADIVLLSDGEDYYEDDDAKLREHFTEEGVRVHGLMLGDTPGEYLTEMCDVSASAYDLAGPNAATDLLATEIT